MKEMSVALYLRLSREDEKHTKEGMAREESNSIGNQRKLLLGFLEGKGEFAGYQVVQYVDDGYSGVSFQRPGFCQMIREIKNGRIQCVVVKDDCVILELNSESPENTGLCDVSSVF